MRILLAALALLAWSPLSAQVRPDPGAGDPRHQLVTYDPNQVVLIQAAPGYQVTIQFAADELIENVAVGDSGAWQITPNKRADILFVKPIQAGIATNLTVVTSIRVYSFDLKPLSGATPQMAYTLRFRYAPEEPEEAATAVDQGRYEVSGARALRPSAISDDGVHTYIQWPKEQDLPAVYAVGADGDEALVNGMMREDIFVIDSVELRLVFRIDKQIARATRLSGEGRK